MLFCGTCIFHWFKACLRFFSSIQSQQLWFFKVFGLLFWSASFDNLEASSPSPLKAFIFFFTVLLFFFLSESLYSMILFKAWVFFFFLVEKGFKYKGFLSSHSYSWKIEAFWSITLMSFSFTCTLSSLSPKGFMMSSFTHLNTCTNKIYFHVSLLEIKELQQFLIFELELRSLGWDTVTMMIMRKLISPILNICRSWSTSKDLKSLGSSLLEGLIRLWVMGSNVNTVALWVILVLSGLKSHIG